MYRKYHTKSLVLKSLDFGESNKLFFIFTEELGLIKASARSVRELKSKLRYGLLDYSLSFLSVIKSKNGWKITGAESVSNFFLSAQEKRYKTICARISALLLKLLPEDEPHPDLFKALAQNFNFLIGNRLDDEEIKSLEYLTVLKILKDLGYLDSEGPWVDFMEPGEINLDVLKGFTVFQKKAVLAINQSFKESQLI